MAPPGRDPQFVLEHSGFVRELVRRLVFDPELARDVEQETWLAALKHEGPARGSERSWLATIARNLARRAWRTKARRKERELDPPPQPSTPTPAEILEREALRREVVEALLALDEPWRETLVLHFLEELPAQTIAERLAVPLETVRTRIKRGLELLRMRLERRTHLHGVALSLALVEAWRIAPPPFAAFAASVTSLSIGAVLMSTATKTLVAAAAVLALVLAYRFSGDPAPAGPGEPQVEAAPVVAPLAARDETTSPPLESSERTELTVEPPSSSPREPSAAPALATVLVRATWSEDGSPAAGVGFVLHASNSVDFYRDSTRHETGADGTARVERIAPGTVSLYADRGSYAKAKAVAGEVVELEIKLPIGFRIDGRVLDVDGTPLSGAQVYLWQCIDDPDQGWVVARSDSRGEYSVRGLFEGINFLSARAAGRAPTVQRLVMSNEGTTVEVDLRFEELGGAVAGRVLDPDGTPVANAVVLIGGEGGLGLRRLPDGTEGRAPAGQRMTTGPDGSFLCDGVAVGDNRVLARSDRLAPWAGTVGVAAGRTSQLEIRLTRGAKVEGIVRNERGEPVERAEIELVSDVNLAGAYRRTKADGKFTMAGLTPGEIELRVEHPELGAAKAKATVADGATENVEIMLSRGLTLAVRIEGVLADWVDGFVHASAFSTEGPGFYRSARIDSRGVAEIPNCPDQPLRIEVHAPGDSLFPRAVAENVLARSGELVIRPDPARTGRIRLSGRVVDVRGEPVTSARIVPTLLGTPGSPIEECDGKTGRFEVGPYSPGTWSVLVQATGYVQARTPSVELANGDAHEFGDIVLQRGGRLAVLGLSRGSGVGARFTEGTGKEHELYAIENRWFSDWLAEGRGWLVTGGGEVALTARRVDVLAGETQEVTVVERRVVPLRLEPAAALAGNATEVEVRDANGVLLGSAAFSGEDGIARVPLAAGRYELRVLSGPRELGRRTLEVTDERGAEPIELTLD